MEYPDWPMRTDNDRSHTGRVTDRRRDAAGAERSHRSRHGARGSARRRAASGRDADIAVRRRAAARRQR
jgi:hypothetical protein